jgi:hypothetical protein
MPSEPAPLQTASALQGLYTQTPDVSAFAVDANAHPADKAGTWVVGPDQMVLACAFNAMRAEVTKFEATLVALGDRDLEAWEAETIKVRRARGRPIARRRLADETTRSGREVSRTRTVGFGTSRKGQAGCFRRTCRFRDPKRPFSLTFSAATANTTGLVVVPRRARHVIPRHGDEHARAFPTPQSRSERGVRTEVRGARERPRRRRETRRDEIAE